MQIGPKPPAPAKKRSALPNLSAAVSEGKALRDEVVEPLKKTLEVTGVTVVDPQAWRSGVGGLEEVNNVTKTHLSSGLRGVTTSLGATGGALGGVYGVAEVMAGARQGDPKKMLSGATEITLATATLASIGLVPGAASLAPVGASLLGLRGLNDVHSGKDGERLSGWRDLVTSASVSAALLHAPTSLVAGLGIVALGFNALGGLSKIKKGHEQNDPFKSAQGNGALLSAAGVGLIATGLGVAPGVGLLVAGAALPLLQRWDRTRAVVDKVTARLDPFFYPAAQRADKVEGAIQKVAQPLLDPVFGWSRAVWRCKPLQPARLATKWAGRTLAQATERMAGRLDGWVGKFRHTIHSDSSSKP